MSREEGGRREERREESRIGEKRRGVEEKISVEN